MISNQMGYSFFIRYFLYIIFSFSVWVWSKMLEWLALSMWAPSYSWLSFISLVYWLTALLLHSFYLPKLNPTIATIIIIKITCK